MLAVLYNCGLRRSEISLLTIDGFVPSHPMLRVPRLKKRGTLAWYEIPLWKRTKDLILDYLKTRTDHSRVLFPSRKGLAPVSGQAVYYIFKNACCSAGVPLSNSPKAMRHSVAVHLMNMGADLADVQEHLGHSSIMSTVKYARVLTPRKVSVSKASERSPCFATF